MEFLGPLLFNIYINDLFCSDEFQMLNFADDCSPYEFNYSTADVIQNLETQTKSLLEWYNSNYLSPNPDKWHLIASDNEPTLFLKVADQSIFNCKNEKVLGVYFDSKLNFEFHLEILCKKAIQTACPCKGIVIHVDKRSSQFGYCPLIWQKNT